MSELKITFVVESKLTLNEEGENHLLDLFARVKSGEIPRDAAPLGFLAAIEKLPNDAAREYILRTIISEVTGLIIQHDLPRFFPGERHGIGVRFSKVAYQETPEPLDPPADAVPQVITVAPSSTIH
jgi:hypothetical protein